MTGSAFWLDNRFGDAMKRPFAFVQSSFLRVLAGFLLIDAVLILANVVAVLAAKLSLIASVPEMLKVTGDLTIPEGFNYLKWAVIAAALIWIAFRDRILPPLLWALVFVMILSDDALQLHENLGDRLSQSLGIPDETLIYGKDIGELAVFGGMGIITLAIFGFLLTRRDVAARIMNMRYILVMIALGFFGVGLDIVHSIIEHLTGASALATLVQQTFGMLEDGGEMVVGSIALALTLAADPASGPDIDKA
jgi:hypothetical protein